MASSLDKSNVNAAFRYGISCYEREMWDDAITHFDRVIYVAPETANVYCFRAKVNACKKKFEQAMQVKSFLTH